MATDRRPPPENARPDRTAQREAKLAQALRANLRRRKAEAGAGATEERARKPEGGESG